MRVVPAVLHVSRILLPGRASNASTRASRSPADRTSSVVSHPQLVTHQIALLSSSRVPFASGAALTQLVLTALGLVKRFRERLV